MGTLSLEWETTCYFPFALDKSDTNLTSLKKKYSLVTVKLSLTKMVTETFHPMLPSPDTKRYDGTFPWGARCPFFDN
jgi:hypothetical protein